MGEAIPKQIPDGAEKNGFLSKAGFPALISVLRQHGYAVIGPTTEQEAIVYAEINSVEQLPIGVHDRQDAGSYRLVKTCDQSYFEFNMGPQSWKQYLFPPHVLVERAKQTSSGWEFETPLETPRKVALLGVRACEIAAISIQDRVFLEGPFVDPDYQARRQSALIVAVNCTVAAKSCFCTSMNTGPRCESGFDLALTEIDDGFVVEIGSQKGAQIAAELPLEMATVAVTRQAEARRQRAVDQIDKHLDTDQLPQLLQDNPEHPQWDEVAQRCLSCTNCTMVCPTCFCATVSEVSELQGNSVERVRQWDSCFNWDFSYAASGVVRNSIRSRYRQWLTHKLATWHGQFDSSGCVGCGRCITWCPVGIDLTEEVAKIRARPTTPRSLALSEESPSSCDVPQSEQSTEEPRV